MLRTLLAGCLLSLCGLAPVYAQSASTPLESYFLGKEVGVKLDMPGTQQGVDLNFDRSPALDWSSYSSRVKNFGVSLHKGDVARVTKFVMKKDRIEFQLDGGGFGTASDDKSTTVSPQYVGKSDYERDLEKQISKTSDARTKRDLQRDLDRERSRRERQEQANKADAAVASQIKAQQVGDKRLHGGSRFNLRWKDAIPSDDRSPDAVMRLLAEYVEFNPQGGGANAGAPQDYAPQQAQAIQGAGGMQIRRGMHLDEVTNLYGQGRVVSDSVSNDGLKTRVVEYQMGDSVASVTYVEGVVVRYAISSR